MFENLYKSFEANRSTFWSYQRLAESRTNPHRLADFARACILVGRIEQTARIIDKEYDDRVPMNEASDLVRWCEETAEAL